ncbi:MAG: NAD(+)/NADH kinase [Rhodobacteraceae bacterium]|nr:NAD(+)/NADH kinase [Paracoccaceae bacterium]
MDTAFTAPDTDFPSPARPVRRVTIIANPKSGRNSRDRDAIASSLKIFGEDATLEMISSPDEIGRLVDRACTNGADVIVAAGGDGTATAVAAAMLGRPQAMAVLPLGTFNYFARGLGFDEDPVEAARQIASGEPHAISVGVVNGQSFLNNASLGIYPVVLRARESVYSRWGRWRLAAHWSLIRTFLRFRRPMKVTLRFGGTEETRRTALVFVARSAYQLERFGLEGADAISDDHFAVLVARAATRRDLWRMAFRLAIGSVEAGRDYDFFSSDDLTIDIHRRGASLLAFDGEKRRARGPFRFSMSTDALKIMLPPHRADEASG